MRLKEKVAIITGAARGIGRACAAEFARQGANLILIDIAHDISVVPYPMGTRSQLDHTAALCREHGASVITCTSDITCQNDVDEALEQALKRFGRIDVLLNNAGIAAPSGKIVHEITDEEWHTMLDIDLTGAWRLIRRVGPHMLHNRAGSIINIASTAGQVGYRHFAGYVTAKHGVIGLTKAAALDYGPGKVRVNAICPGSVRDNEFHEGRMLKEIARSLDVDISQYESVFTQAQPMNSLLEPEDIANTCIWLASDESTHVTGSVITVDGGFTAK
ncbi:SDR family oxidoreductase [Dickeya zeae]|uniref:SDR family oxidoreductase n=1 Tax=Dickeya zeae TaxID=204042 RepID=UPI0003A2FE9E|nr:SDR family oxidoreductase [Dickeya zeae]